MRELIVGTRGSQLALTQTHSVVEMIVHRMNHRCRIEVIHTTGDIEKDIPLDSSGEIGLFTRALERALLDGEIDIAVHSLKDLPLKMPDGLAIAAVPHRGEVGDVMLIAPEAHHPAGEGEHSCSWIQIPIRQGAIVGTGSPRRRAEIKSVRDDLIVQPIRGNVTTRINLLKSGQVDALVMAAAGLKRLNLNLGDLILHPLDTSFFVPAPGQGALAIQMRSDDLSMEEVYCTLNDPITEACVLAERGLLELFGGGCSLPMGALVTMEGDDFQLCGFWFDGKTSHYAQLIHDESDEGVNQLFIMLRKD